MRRRVCVHRHMPAPLALGSSALQRCQGPRWQGYVAEHAAARTWARLGRKEAVLQPLCCRKPASWEAGSKHLPVLQQECFGCAAKPQLLPMLSPRSCAAR